MASEDAYAEHIQSDDICIKRGETTNDRIGENVWKKLEFKKPPFSLHHSEQAKWRLMYKILFSYD